MSGGPYFVDTAYWIGLVNPRDSYHHTALEITNSIGAAQLITSELVFAETLNSLAGNRYLRARAHQLVKRLYTEPYVEVVPQTHTLFRRALDRYGQYQDKAWGLVDCASFIIMDDYFIQDALTTDVHFVQAGFNALLREQ